MPDRVRKHLAFASPWLLATAIGLLALIILVFTANNLRREERLVSENLLNKGQALVHFAGAGTRASMMMGPEPGRRVQHLLEQAALEPGIVYLTVIDQTGLILADSDPEMVGRDLGRDTASLRELAADSGYQVRQQAGEQVFEVVRPFRPFERRRGRHSRFFRSGMAAPEESPWRCEPGRGPQPPRPAAEAAKDQPPAGQQDRLTRPGLPQLMLVGLDMSEQMELVRQNRLHMILMSLALLLVGAGGWLSLLTLQGYRISQETLRQIRAFADLLISRLPVGIVATGPEGTVKTYNQAAADLTGRPQPAGPEHTPAELLPPELAGYFKQNLQDAEVLDQEVRLVDGGGERVLEVSSVPVRDEEQAFMGRVLLLSDVTGQRLLEQELRRHDRLVALGKMAAGVAHEVRNPLSSIKGFATLLGSSFQAGSKEAETARLLIREVERLNRTITELLDYSRPLPLQLEGVGVAKLLGESLHLIEPDARSLGIEIHLEIEEDLPEISADPDRLNQVLLNLYLNSLQAMASGGSLQLRACRGEKPGTLEIAVRDTGCGIPEELLERITDPYFTTKPGGTGLGLALVQKIVEEHGGAIRWESREGEGTTARLLLPIRPGGKGSLS